MEKEEKRADQENDTEEQSTEAKSLLKKKLQYYSSEIQRDVGNLVKWLMIAVLVGCITGAASTLFSFVLKSVTNCRKENEWMFYLLPVMGLIIVYLYEKFGKDDGGTNQVLSTVRSQDDVPILSAPLIFISTALTHLAGGSAGREGAAIQLGGSIANQLGRWIHLDEEDRHVIVMCGMSAAFSALFGTPMAAAVFALEVVSVGVMYYTALMPCMIASLVASGFAAGMGVTPETFHVVDIPKLTIETGLKMGAIAVGCAVISIVFCMVLNGVALFHHRPAGRRDAEGGREGRPFPVFREFHAVGRYMPVIPRAVRPFEPFTGKSQHEAPCCRGQKRFSGSLP